MQRSVFLIATVAATFAPVLILSSVVEAQQSIDLSDWTQEGVTAGPNWELAPDGLSVLQTVNTPVPTFYVSPNTFIETTIRGQFGVITTSDDDFIGFVFGYDAPLDANEDDPKYNDFILFDWKQAPQEGAGAGFRLAKVLGTHNNGSHASNQFWTHTSDANITFTSLASPQVNAGWANNTFYEFELVYQLDQIVIRIKGGTGPFSDWVTIFDLHIDDLPAGTFPGDEFPIGRFGFYNLSQEMVQYEGFTQEGEPVLGTNPPNGGTLDVGFVRVGEMDNAVMTISNVGGIGSNLSGEVSSVASPFTGPLPDSTFVIPEGESEQKIFEYEPESRISDSDVIEVTSDGGNATINLTGTGVGPVFDSSPPAGETIEFGVVDAADNGSATLTIVNVTSDTPDEPELTGLSILGVEISGEDVSKFTLVEPSLPTVIAKGDQLPFEFEFAPDGGQGEFSATVTVLTDEDAPFGELGSDYVFDLVAESTDLPDLIVTSVTSSTEGLTDQAFGLSWEVTNAGAGEAVGPWADRAYISTQPDFDESSQPLGPEVSFPGTLQPDESYTRSQEYTYPASPGTYWIHVVTDVNDDVNETAKGEQNNVSEAFGPITVEATPVPDLIVDSIVPPADGIISGTTTEITYTVTNIGTGATSAPSWLDGIYLLPSNNPDQFDIPCFIDFVNANQWLGEFPNPSFLPAGESYSNTVTVDIPENIQGQFYIAVYTDNRRKSCPWKLGQVYDVVEIDEFNNILFSESFSIQLQPQPDIQVVQGSIIVPSLVFSGESLDVSWTEINAGEAPTNTGTWSHAIYFSTNTDPEISSDDVHFKTITTTIQPLQPGQSHPFSTSSGIPPSFSGMYYVKVFADSNDDVTEIGSEHNNVGVSSVPVEIILSPAVDLVPKELELPDPAITYPAHTISVTFSGENQGAPPSPHFPLNWSDGIYLSASSEFDPDDALLLLSVPQSTTSGDDGLTIPPYTKTRQVTIPDSVDPGDYFIHLFVDRLNQVYEGDCPDLCENNNVISAALSIDAQYANLSIEAVSPDPGTQIPLATQVALSWEVVNTGDVVTPVSSWADRIYLSVDDIPGPDDVILATVPRTGVLDPQESYLATSNATIPVVEQGSYYLVFITDHANAVFEGPGGTTDNVVAVPIMLSDEASDLIVSSIIAPAQAVAGKTAEVSWSILNQGTQPTNVSTWVDRVYFSPSATFDESAVLVASKTRSGALPEGESYEAFASFTVPFSLVGDYYVFVHTDASNAVFETDTENNIGIAAGTVDVAPGNAADLVVPLVTGPSFAVAGEDITVQWTVENQGTLPTDVANWVDHVFLSPSPAIGSGAVHVASHAHSGVLQPEESYNASAMFTVPHTLAGAHYILVRTDANNVVFETDDQNNVGVSGKTIAIEPVTLPNLRVISVEGPVEAVSGQPMIVEWTVINDGEGATFTNWHDSVYLSLDPFLDIPGDLHLGTVANPTPIAPGETYTQTKQLNVPLGTSGLFFVLVMTDRLDTVPETNEDDNIGVAPMLTSIEIPPPGDLVVDSVGADSAEIVLGESASFNWSIGNIGDSTVQGQWMDSLYLSTQPFWTLDARKIGTFTTSGTIEPDGSVSNSATATVPGVTPGEYYVIARADVFNNIPETDLTNNVGVSLDTVTVSAIPLELDVPFNGTLANGQNLYFELPAPAGETVRITLDHASPTAWTEMYVRFGAMPTPGQFDFQFGNPGLPDQEIVIPTTQGGTYYILARATAGANPPDVTVLAETLPLLITAFTPEAAANDFTTLSVSGARFSPGTTFAIQSVKSGATYILPNSLFVDASLALMQFDFGQVPLGEYFLSATDGNETVVADSTLLVEESTGSMISVEFPSQAPGRIGISSSRPMIIRNESNADAAVVYCRLIIGLPSDLVTAPPEFGDPLAWPEGNITQYSFVLGNLPAGGTHVSNLLFDSNVTGVPVSLVATGYTWQDYLNVRVPQISEGFRLDVLERFEEIYPQLTPEETELLLQFYNDSGAVLAAFLEDVEINGPLILQDVEESATGSGFLQQIRRFGCSSACVVAGAKHAPFATSILGSIPVVGGALGCLACCELFDPCDPFCTKVVDLYTMSSNWNPTLPPLPPTGSLNCCIANATGGGSLCDAVTSCIEAFLESVGGTGLPPGAGLGNICDPYTQAFDPNEKTGFTGFGKARWVPKAGPIPYTIYYENIPEATAPAARVEIRDVLDPGMNAATFRLGNIEFGDITIPVPPNQVNFTTTIDLTDQLGWLVDVVAGVNAAFDPAEAFWILQTIDPETGEPPTDGLSGFLPPEDGTGAGQGRVHFTIQPKPSVITGQIVENTAEIVFDVNEPIITNTVFNTIDADLPVSMLAELPQVVEGPEVVLNVSGYDPPGGSGLAGFRLLVSVDGSSFVPFTFTPESSGVFTGSPGHVYGFASRAVDNAGNIEPMPPAPMAMTAIPSVDLEPDSDSGIVGDGITNINTPEFLLVSAPLSDVNVVIENDSFSISGIAETGTNGRGIFAVPDDEPLPDGTYLVMATSHGVSTTMDLVIDTVAAAVLAWQAVQEHGSAGEGAIPVGSSEEAVEPRASGLTRLLVRFDPDEPDLAHLAPESITIIGHDLQNNEIDLSEVETTVVFREADAAYELQFAPTLPDKARYCITLEGVTDLAGNGLSLSDARRTITALVGDVTGDQRTNNTDVGAVMSLLGTDPIDPANWQHVVSDLNSDGRIDELDLQIALDARGTDARFINDPCPKPGGDVVARRSMMDKNLYSTDMDGATGTGDPSGSADGFGAKSLPYGGDATEDDDASPVDVADDVVAYIFDGTIHELIPQPSRLLVYEPFDRFDVPAVVERWLRIERDAVSALPMHGWWLIDSDNLAGEGMMEHARDLLARRGMFVSPVFAGENGGWIAATPALLVRFAEDFSHQAMMRHLRRIDRGITVSDWHYADVPGLILAETSYRDGEDVLRAAYDIAQADGIAFAEVEMIFTGKGLSLGDLSLVREVFSDGSHQGVDLSAAASRELQRIEAPSPLRTMAVLGYEAALYREMSELNRVQAVIEHPEGETHWIEITPFFDLDGSTGDWIGRTREVMSALASFREENVSISVMPYVFGFRSGAVAMMYDRLALLGMIHVAFAGQECMANDDGLPFPAELGSVTAIGALDGARKPIRPLCSMVVGPDFVARITTLVQEDSSGERGLPHSSAAVVTAADIISRHWSENNAASVADMLEMLRNTAIDLGAPGYDPMFGWGELVFGESADANDPVPDFNGDGVVDVADLIVLFRHWGTCEADTDCLADLNLDGVVDVEDVMILLKNWD